MADSSSPAAGTFHPVVLYNELKRKYSSLKTLSHKDRDTGLNDSVVCSSLERLADQNNRHAKYPG